MTSSRTAKIRERLEAATPGPWYQYCYLADGSGDPMPQILAKFPGKEINFEIATTTFRKTDSEQHIIDATFIANAPSDLQYLLAKCDILERALEEILAEVGTSTLSNKIAVGAIEKCREIE